jgi:16S rRNA (cytidine1402-2'-O)-methyltransferase
MSGILYIVGTPIGNMEDITFRAVQTLSEADFIAAEDTRVSVKILNKFNIKKPLVSYHEHSGLICAEKIISRIEAGEKCAFVSDAGMPCISDPGELLVKLCYEKAIDVKVVPGPSAAVSALAVSGLDTSRFSFEGFLSVSAKKRFSHLEEAKNYNYTLIFYEAPHKLMTTLHDLLDYFGDRKISLCREMTKVYEEVIRTTISGAVEIYENKTPKGEFVLIIEGKPAVKNQEISFEDAVKMVAEMLKSGEKSVDACKAVAKETGYKKGELYSALNNIAVDVD